jgi:4,5-DOPA dioxygenase extradiol
MEKAVSFISHGAPTIVLDKQRGHELQQWAEHLWPRNPDLVIIVSAHWQTVRPALGIERTEPLIYDFAGFPEQLYRLKYEAPGAGTVRESIREHMRMAGYDVQLTERRWDHGVWTPLYWLFPEADVPVLQFSLPRLEPDGLFDLGHQLGLWVSGQSRSIWLIGSGGLTHNLGWIDFSNQAPVPDEIKAFEQWAKSSLQRDLRSITDFRTAPFKEMNHPTDEHFLPLLLAAGAASAMEFRNVEFPVGGFEFGTLSRAAIDFRPVP